MKITILDEFNAMMVLKTDNVWRERERPWESRRKSCEDMASWLYLRAQLPAESKEQANFFFKSVHGGH